MPRVPEPVGQLKAQKSASYTEQTVRDENVPGVTKQIDETAVTTMAHDAMQLARNEGVNALVQQALQADTPAKAFICLAAASFRGAAEAAATLSQTPKETIAALVLEQQIAALEQQDAAHDQNIAALEQEIAERKQVIALEQQIAALEQQNAARDEKIAAGEQEIAALEQEIAAREARMV